MLIAATSGRALAEAACRSGLAPLVADAFADLDTRAMALAVEKLGLDFEEASLSAALRRLGEGRAPIGLVYGAGFEDRPRLLAAIARDWRLFGNDADTVRRLKDPFGFAALCRRLAIPHPEVAEESRPGWLSKRIGGAGGGHVGGAEGAGRYHQRRVEGVPVSALFLADGRHAEIVGFSRQWSSPAPGHPFRYGGAVRPAELPSPLVEALTAAVSDIVRDTGLKGLNSADFIVAPALLGADPAGEGDAAEAVTASFFAPTSTPHGAMLLEGEKASSHRSHDWWLIEINPRPGATLDIFGCEGLFAAHLAACAGELPERPFCFEGAAAAAVVYADRDIAALPECVWPDWASDRQPAGSSLAAGEPLCTVRSRARTTAAACRWVRSRERKIRSILESAMP